MPRFKPPDQAQRFLFTHAFIYHHVHRPRYLMAANNYRGMRIEAFNIWRQQMRACTAA